MSSLPLIPIKSTRRVPWHHQRAFHFLPCPTISFHFIPCCSISSKSFHSHVLLLDVQMAVAPGNNSIYQRTQNCHRRLSRVGRHAYHVACRPDLRGKRNPGNTFSPECVRRFKSGDSGKVHHSEPLFLVGLERKARKKQTKTKFHLEELLASTLFLALVASKKEQLMCWHNAHRDFRHYAFLEMPPTRSILAGHDHVIPKTEQAKTEQEQTS